MLMLVLDATIVNVALPSAQQALGFSDSDREWVVTAYALAFGRQAPPGRDADAFTFAVDGAAALGLHPVYFAGASKLATVSDAVRSNAEREGQLNVVRPICVDEGIDRSCRHATDALRHTFTIRGRPSNPTRQSGHDGVCR